MLHLIVANPVERTAVASNPDSPDALRLPDSVDVGRKRHASEACVNDQRAVCGRARISGYALYAVSVCVSSVTIRRWCGRTCHLSRTCWFRHTSINPAVVTWVPHLGSSIVSLGYFGRGALLVPEGIPTHLLVVPATRI